MKRKIELLMGLCVILCAFVLARKGAVFVQSEQAKSAPVCIVVDAGHGGDDPGKIGINDALEKDINLQIALKLQKIALTILETMLIVFFRAVILYILIVISIRLMGKRQIANYSLGACYNASAFKHRHPAYRGYDYTDVNGHSAYIHTSVLDVILSHCSLKFRGLESSYAALRK